MVQEIQGKILKEIYSEFQTQNSQKLLVFFLLEVSIESLAALEEDSTEATMVFICASEPLESKKN